MKLKEVTIISLLPIEHCVHNMSCKSSNQSFQCILLFRYPAKKLPLYFLFSAADSKDVLWKALWVILLHHISCYSSYTDKSNEFVAICDTRHTIIPISDCEFQNNIKSLSRGK